jgi:mycothiol synthase
MDSNFPSLTGIAFRGFREEADFVHLTNVINAGHRHDGVEDVETVDSMRSWYVGVANFDLSRDVIIAEADGAVVAFGRTRFGDEESGARQHWWNLRVLPAWRRKGLGRAMLGWLEARARAKELEAAERSSAPNLSTFTAESETDGAAFARAMGYAVARYDIEMRRLTRDPIPDYTLPGGFELRPATPDQFRAIWEADREAFRDHWGYTTQTEVHYTHWLNQQPPLRPELWKVAWHIESNQIAAMVLNELNESENAALNVKRGWTENISTTRAFRRQGLARALLCESIRMFRDMGMDDTMLSADAENLTGAVRVYTDCGYRVVQTGTQWRKALHT